MRNLYMALSTSACCAKRATLNGYALVALQHTAVLQIPACGGESRNTPKASATSSHFLFPSFVRSIVLSFFPALGLVLLHIRVSFIYCMLLCLLFMRKHSTQQAPARTARTEHDCVPHGGQVHSLKAVTYDSRTNATDLVAL